MLLEVCKQNIHISEPVTLVSGTIGEYVAQFIFHEGWDDYAAIAVFKPSKGEIVEQLIGAKNTVQVPDEVLVVDGGKVKPTVWSPPINIIRGTDTNGLINPTPGVVEQILDLFKGGNDGDHLEKNSDDNYDFSWKTPPEELPPVTEDDNGMHLEVVDGHWDKAQPPEELPDVDVEDNGKVLAVVNGSWAKKELYSEVENSAGGITANINTL